MEPCCQHASISMRTINANPPSLGSPGKTRITARNLPLSTHHHHDRHGPSPELTVVPVAPLIRSTWHAAALTAVDPVT
jgi:hypothetical protein